MDGVSGAFAVVSLTLQLLNSVQDINKVVKRVKDAPGELDRLAETLDRLKLVLDETKLHLDQQRCVMGISGSTCFLLDALKTCEKRLKALESLVDRYDVPLRGRKSLQKKWASLKLTREEDRISVLESQIRDAKADLQCAILMNYWPLL